MIRAVVKHSYVKGAKGKARAVAHVNYIQYRGGEDREQGPRQFFDKDRQQVPGREVKAAIREQNDGGVRVHKLILSPGLNNVDLQAYTREILDQLGREKGLDLDWKAVEHRNTDHHHVHVVIMGTDKNGRTVRIGGKDDYDKLRESGDRYLDREHKLERYLDREMRDLMDESRGYNGINRLLFGTSRDEKDRERTPQQLARDLDQFIVMDKELRRAMQNIGSGGEIGRRIGHKEYVRQQQGRLLSEHGQYTRLQRKHELNRQLADHPELAGDIKSELAYVAQIERDERLDNQPTDFDRLVGNDKQWQRPQGQKQHHIQQRIHSHVENESRAQDQERSKKDTDDFQCRRRFESAHIRRVKCAELGAF